MLENILHSLLTSPADLTIIDYNKPIVKILDKTPVSPVDLPIFNNSKPIVHAWEKHKRCIFDDFEIDNSHSQNLLREMRVVIDFLYGA